VPLTQPVPMASKQREPEFIADDVVIPSDPALARAVQDRIEQLLLERRLAERDLFGIKLALEEAIVNAMKHGNQMDRSKTVRIAYRIDADRFEIVITDEGPGFDPEDVPDPTAFENLERPCGRGLLLMRHYMTDVRHNARGNSVTMSKVFRDGKK
jgi:serine/threonine-protein kinase RsbW